MKALTGKSYSTHMYEKKRKEIKGSNVLKNDFKIKDLHQNRNS